MVTSTRFNVSESAHKNWWPLAPPSSLGTYIKMENRIYFSLYIIWDKQSTRELWPGSKCSSILHSNCHKYLNIFFFLHIFLTLCLSCNMENTWPKILKLSFTRWHKFLTQSHLQKWRMMCIWHLLNKIWLLWSKGEFGSENSSMSACHAFKKVSHWNCPLLKITYHPVFKSHKKHISWMSSKFMRFFEKSQ